MLLRITWAEDGCHMTCTDSETFKELRLVYSVAISRTIMAFHASFTIHNER